AVLRDGPDEGRGARLVRSAPVAPGSAAAAEDLAEGHPAQLLGFCIPWYVSRVSVTTERGRRRCVVVRCGSRSRVWPWPLAPAAHRLRSSRFYARTGCARGCSSWGPDCGAPRGRHSTSP